MPFEPLDALDGIEKHRLDQVEDFARCNHKFPLGQTFAPFFSRLAVGDDSRTQTKRGASPDCLQVARDASRSVMHPALRANDRADRDITSCAAATTDQHDQPSFTPARFAFEPT